MHRNGKLKLPSWAGALVLWAAPLAFLGVFYLYPLVNILKISFTHSDRAVSPLIQALSSRSIQHVLWFTVWQAILSTALTLLLGLPGAYLMARYDFRGKALVQALSGIPFVLPTLVVAAAFNALLGPRGWVNLALMALLKTTQPPVTFVNSLSAILIAHVFYNTTIVLRLVGDFWAHLDPHLGQAARMLGANKWQELRYVSLPLLAPAITAAALLVFIFVFTSFGVILVLGGPRFATLEVEIYNQTLSLFNLPIAAALSIIQLICTLVFSIIYTRRVKHLARPLSLHPRRYTQHKLSNWREKILAGALIALLLGLLTTPLAALAARSFTRFEAERGQHTLVNASVTLDFYKELLINRRQSVFYIPPVRAIGVSFSYAAITVILALALGFPAAWALSRDSKEQKSPIDYINQILDPLLMLPLGTSAVTMGLGFLVALGRPPLDLRASPILVPLAHTLVAFPFVVRSLTPALRSIRPRLRQAAAVMGAPPLQVLRQIDLPLTGRAIIVAATFAFTISLGEFGATAMISRPEFPTIPVAIYRFISQPGALNYGQALALSTILMAVTAAGMLVIERLRIADIGEF
ncbi:MAG: iron ABC transporter permease [Chloroflexi bacterium]|nr:iron ABC transporter permease [Chloroflexota bacterium]